MSVLDDVLAAKQRTLRPYISKNNIEAYRILPYLSSELPVAVDVYKDNAVIHVVDQLDKNGQKELEGSLVRAAGAQYFFYKNRTKEKIELPKSSSKEIIINEYGNAFLINLSDYLDTGIFLDQRETRKWIGVQSRGKAVLNTFSYTGTFSVYAARGGAKLTHSVDLSKTYGEWTKRNFQLNGMNLEDNWVLRMDTREYFKYARRKKLIFDIIIIDPPTFSRNKGASFSVQRDHPELINEALEILAPDGFILFSNNYMDFTMKESRLHSCLVKQKEDTLPPDFAGTEAHRCFVITRR